MRTTNSHVTQCDSPMTESDWLASTDRSEIYRPYPNLRLGQMLEFLRVQRRADKTKSGRRKLRLFACACCRRFWSSLNEQSREALSIAERFADGEASKKEFGYAWRISVRQYGRGPRTADGIAGHVVEAGAMTAAATVPTVCYSVVASSPRATHELWDEVFQQIAIVHDLFGNPFQAAVKEVASRLSKVESVRELADRIYQSRNFSDLSALLKQLEEAGCADLDIIEHCRKSEHFRGCWLVDALRGVPF